MILEEYEFTNSRKKVLKKVKCVNILKKEGNADNTKQQQQQHGNRPHRISDCH